MYKRIISLILYFTLISIIMANPALAINDPTSISISETKAYENIFEDGDMLFVAYYYIQYAPEPSETPEEAFRFELLEVAAASIIASTSVTDYQYDLISIYLTSAQVTSLGVTWGSSYVLRITGNPAIFASITEGTNMVSRTLSPFDWNADGTTTSLSQLRIELIDIMTTLQSDNGTTMLATSATGEISLNSAGSTIMLDAVHNINIPLPDLFQLSNTIPTVDNRIAAGTYAQESNLSSRMGSTLADAFSGIGTFLGIGQAAAAAAWGMMLFLTVCSIVFLSSGNSSGALVMGTPMIAMLGYLGIIPLGILFTIIILGVIYVLYLIF